MTTESNELSDNDVICLKFWCENYLDKTKQDTFDPTEKNLSSLENLVRRGYLSPDCRKIIKYFSEEVKQGARIEDWRHCAPTDTGLQYYHLKIAPKD